jgi:hypothetical protein
MFLGGAMGYYIAWGEFITVCAIAFYVFKHHRPLPFALRTKRLTGAVLAFCFALVVFDTTVAAVVMSFFFTMSFLALVLFLCYLFVSISRNKSSAND